MTDARVPERYLVDRRIVRLSDQAFRAYIMATLWSVANRTEGVIELDDLALISGFEHPSAKVLVDAGLWEPHSHGFVILDFEATQTTKAQLESIDRKRASDRDRQARHRDKKADPVTRDITRDVTRDVKGKDRLGEDRPGQALNNHLDTDETVASSRDITPLQRDALASWNEVQHV